MNEVRTMVTGERLDNRLLGVLRLVSPGTPLREAMERILRAEAGALIVLGAPPQVQALFTGGFRINVPFTAQRLSELAKMDGALVLDSDARAILWANVHLMPDPAVPTVETGIRHRTAERVARQTGVPVIAVSESMRTVILYVDEWRHVVDEVAAVLSRANQAVQTLRHYRARFDEASSVLDALELQGHATMRMVLALLSRGEMVRRIAGEVECYVAELGTDGRLLRLQLDELGAGVEEEQRLAVRDYLRQGRGADADEVLEELARRSPEDLSDPGALAKSLDLAGNPDALDQMVGPRGYRLLSKVRELPSSVIARVVERFGSLKVILAAGLEDLEEVEGVGLGRARNLREGLARLAETSALEHYA
ncbi:MAG TPA: DNA integrity scanning diadenylate cyclase DisA [Actinomycetes bacterium]|jgi:diadenylate cyclase|nr:DNA integrity scanning diadenylate cyclase DisA [Actinomycetes bacterium]